MTPERQPTDGVAVMTFVFDATLDYAQVLTMARIVDDAISQEGELRLLLDLRMTERFKPHTFLSPKGLLTSLRSIGPVSRYAVVGAPAIAAVAVESFGTILPLKTRALMLPQSPRPDAGFPAATIDASHKRIFHAFHIALCLPDRACRLHIRDERG